MKWAIFLSFLSLAMICTAANEASTKVKWGYTGHLGPEYWAQLDPSFGLCSKGQSQSPINIPRKVTEAPFDLTLNYTDAPLDIVNDGQTALLLGKEQTIIDQGHGIQVNFHGDAETLTFAGQTYKLIQFHIHTPSENEIRGQAFPLEIHFVHQGDDGVAVLAVFAKGGLENAELKKVIQNIPSEKGKNTLISGKSINPAALLPSKRDYYHFMGSLTTPPCTEGLRWIVLATPITVAPQQIMLLRKAAGGVNARPVKPLYGRSIEFSRENK